MFSSSRFLLKLLYKFAVLWVWLDTFVLIHVTCKQVNTLTVPYTYLFFYLLIYFIFCNSVVIVSLVVDLVDVILLTWVPDVWQTSLTHSLTILSFIATRSGSTGTDDSERTIAGRVDSQDSTMSDNESADPRCTRQNSVTSVSQWDIPYDELDRGEIIGRGRFGIVYSGNWHGHVAIKELRMDYVNDEKTLEAFKAEVSLCYSSVLRI